MNRFPRVSEVRPGYDPDEVDALIKRIEATLGKGVLESEPVTADELRAARFRVRLGGYNELAVDYALEAFIIAVENKDVTPRRAPSASAVEAPQGFVNGSVIDAFTVGEAVPAAAAQAVPVSRERADEDHARPPASAEPGTTGARSTDGAVTAIDGVRPEAAEPPEPGAGDETADGAHAAVADAPAETWFEEQAARVERARFRSGRLGMGYNEDEVDAFLDRVVATLRGATDAPLTPADVRDARFSTVLLRPGYAIGEVDEFLAELAEVIAKRTPEAADRE
ncbi:DivIVA domain-containing protein [Thermopolyspora sp. NPDC052614]|uniref:DivIVA domain-containing protein n=1 Tax=Thermopolyspora sp. NPDC052614 TaxID=3155682 RepID=UPI0034271F9D